LYTVCIFIQFSVYIGRFKVAENFLEQKIDKTTPLAFFLCKLSGEGSGFMAMIDFLAFSHNEFLTSYKNTRGAVVRHASLLKASDADVISYSSNSDLLPLVYTHCNYSLELGKGTKIGYNFDKILENLMDKVFCGKSILEIQIQEFVYSDDVHSGQKFTNLGKVIPQVGLLVGRLHVLSVFFLAVFRERTAFNFTSNTFRVVFRLLNNAQC